MKILLINPPVENIIDSEAPMFIKQHEGIFPPLGLMYIAAYLKKQLDCEVGILDTLAEKIGYEAIKERIVNFNPDVVGITTYTNNLRDVIMVSDMVKDINKDIHVCLGGPHVNIFPKETLDVVSVDSLVFGDGEITFAELIKSLQDKTSLEKIEGIAFKSGNNYNINTAAKKEVEDLDILPFPERGMIDYKRYYSLLGKSSFMTTMSSSRGCPFRCSFCSTPRGRYRARSPENIADEMEECLKLGISEIHFIDDTFNVDMGRVINLCNEIRKRRLNINWSFRGRISGFTKPALKELKRAGCYRTHLGVETSSDEGLQALNKDVTIEEIRNTFKLIRDAGIESVAYFLIGCPREKNKKDILRTIRFSRELDPDFCLFNILTLYPSTVLYEDAVRKGMLDIGYWKSFASDPSKSFKLPFWEEWMGAEELNSLLNLAYKKFYFRLKVIVRILMSSCDARVSVKKLKAGVKFLDFINCKKRRCV